MSLSLFCFVCFSFALLLQISYISKLVQRLSFSVWLMSLNMIASRSIHVVANGKISFFFYCWLVSNCVYVCVYTHTHTHHIFIHSSIDGHLGWVHILATVNNAKWIYGCIHLIELVCVFLGFQSITWVESLVHIIVLFLIFLRNLDTVFHNGCTYL